MTRYLFIYGSLSLAAMATRVRTEEVREIPPMTVRESPLESVQQIGQDVSLAANLSAVPGVVVLSQGQPAGQSDLSIRGSAFSGAGLSIAGLSLRNAQTEHFHAELPFPAGWLGEPRVLTGVRQTAATEGHLTGTVELRPMPIVPGLRLNSGLDNRSGYWLNAQGQTVRETEPGERTGVGVSAGHREIPSVDFPDNDVRISSGAGRWQRSTPSSQADLWLGHQEKTFGARGYYGVSDALKAEETNRDTLLLGAWESSDTESPLSASLLLRQFEDEYSLFLPTGLFRNEHTTRTAATQISGTRPLQESMDLSWRLAADVEDIDSSNLGDFSRSRVAATLLPGVQLHPAVRLQAGVRGEWLEDDPNQVLPQARLEVTLHEQLLWHSEVSATARRPSYTELNYESPGSLGNQGLKVQNQRALETGLTWTPSARQRLAFAVFQHRTRDTVDWIRPEADSPRWEAENIGDVDTLGVEVQHTLQLPATLALTSYYQWLDKDNDFELFASRYALDTPRHLAQVQLDWTPHRDVRLELSQLFRDQTKNALRTDGGNQQWLTRAAIHVRVPRCETAQVSLIGSNLTKDDYRVFPGQDTVTNRRLALALTLDW